MTTSIPGNVPKRDLVGTILAGRYRIIQKLGDGAMGEVYLGEHLAIGRKDAIKVLRDSLARDPEAIARFTRGTRMVSSITHPNVCTIYDFSETPDGLRFLAMEYVPGETLKDLLARERVLPVERAIHIAAQVADALQAAHDVRIVHRDLKPANLMLVRDKDGRDRVKVVDFDIAKSADEADRAAGGEVTRLGFVVGTPEYMSPEQLMGDRLDGRSDIYSLGIILFRMLTGELPFRAATAQDMMIQRLTEPPLTLEAIQPGMRFPPGLQQVLDRALARKAEERYPDAATFRRELLAVLGHVAEADLPRATSATAAFAGIGRTPGAAGSAADLAPTYVAPPARTPGMASGAEEGPRRRSVPVIAAGAALVLIGAAAAGWILFRGGEAPALEPQPSGPTAGATAGANPNADQPRTSPPVTTPSDRVSSDPGTTDPPRQAVRPTPDAARRTDPAESRPTTAATSAPGIRVDLADVNDLLFRQLDALDVPGASRSVLRAAQDTARAVWAMPGVPAADRALAAYVLASVHFELGEPAACVEWIDRALAIRPNDRSYTNLRESCRGVLP